MAARAAYGSNPHAGINPNDDHGWGGYHWPNGVPGNLLAVVTVPGNVKIVVRRELAELVGLNYQIAQVKYGRDFHRGWTGGYENRPIAGTQTPSNHSKGKAIDNDAQDNPMSSIFQCNIPPELVADWESTGWYWGGRYSGKSDTMHFEYCFSPADVPGHVKRARAILAAALGRAPESPSTPSNNPTPAPAPTAPPEIGPPAAQAPNYPGLLQHGSKGPAVKTMQARLNLHLQGSAGKPGVPAVLKVDGSFGDKTAAAVRWFQTMRHDAPFNLAIDGEVGPRTWSALWRGSRG